MGWGSDRWKSFAAISEPEKPESPEKEKIELRHHCEEKLKGMVGWRLMPQRGVAERKEEP